MIRVKVDVQEDCNGNDQWILLDENGYIVATLHDDAVKCHDLHISDMKLISHGW